MGGMRSASAASEAIEAEVSLKVWDVFHTRAVGEGEGASVASGGGVSPSEVKLPPVGLASSRRRRRIASKQYLASAVCFWRRRFPTKYCFKLKRNLAKNSTTRTTNHFML